MMRIITYNIYIIYKKYKYKYGIVEDWCKQNGEKLMYDLRFKFEALLSVSLLPTGYRLHTSSVFVTQVRESPDIG